LEDGTSKKGFLALLLKPFRRNSLSPTEFEEELNDLLDHRPDSEALTKHSGDMIHSIFEFNETVARKIMTPRIDVVGVEVRSTIGDVINTAVKEGYSRLPVYRGDLDHVEGFVMVKDLLGYWGEDLNTPLPEKIVRSVIQVHGNKKIGEILNELRQRKSHLAIVLDEYGGVAGIVTLEDIIEVIVGEIHDEYDEEETEEIEELSPGLYKVTGQTAVSDINLRLNLDIPQGNYETLGGFLTNQLNRVPKTGEVIRYNKSLLKVTAAEERKVDTVEIRIDAENPQEA
jgi:CBS domain containing-hemolysin-like protein